MKVFESVDGVDVYWNESGSITIEQEDRLGDPQLIVIPAERVKDLCVALNNLIYKGQDA